MIELCLIGLLCTPFVGAGLAFIGIFINGIGDYVDKRRARKKKEKAKAAKKVKKQQEQNKITIKWRQHNG